MLDATLMSFIMISCFLVFQPRKHGAFRMFQWKKQNCGVPVHSVKRPNHQTSGRKRSMRKRMHSIRALACWKEMGSVGSKFGIPKDRVFRSLNQSFKGGMIRSSLLTMLYIAFHDIQILVQGQRKRYLPNDMGCMTLKKNTSLGNGCLHHGLYGCQKKRWRLQRPSCHHQIIKSSNSNPSNRRPKELVWMTRMVPSMHSSCSRSKRLCIKDLFGWEIADRRVLFVAKRLGKSKRKIAKKGVPFLKCSQKCLLGKNAEQTF